MAGFNIENQFSGTLPGGLRIEAGAFSGGSDGTSFIPTRFTKLLGGMATGDITDHVIGHAVSICEGPTIKMALTDSTGVATVNYIAFGW